MKKTILILTAFFALTITSCKKDDDSNFQPKASTLLFTLYNNNWGHIGTSGSAGDGYEADLLATNITTEIAATGTVLCYISFNNSSWVQLNYTVPFDTYSESWDGSFSAGHYIIDVLDSDHLTLNPGGPVYCRVVTLNNVARMKNPNVDYTKYEEVKRAFNLKD